MTTMTGHTARERARSSAAGSSWTRPASASASLASRVAVVLEGKHKPTFATHIDTGDHVIVLNAAKVDLSGDKTTAQVATPATAAIPGGLRSETLGELLARRPEEVIRRAVKGMLPRNKLGVQQLRKLKVYAGAEHPHEAQQPAAAAQGGSAS